MTACLRILQQRVELYANDVQRNSNGAEQLDEIEKTFANMVHDTSKRKRDVEVLDSTSSASSTERYKKKKRTTRLCPSSVRQTFIASLGLSRSKSLI